MKMKSNMRENLQFDEKLLIQLEFNRNIDFTFQDIFVIVLEIIEGLRTKYSGTRNKEQSVLSFNSFNTRGVKSIRPSRPHDSHLASPQAE